MSKIHIALRNGQRMEFEESQLHSSWQADSIPADSLYWKEGMAGWEPIAGLLGAAAPAAGSTPEAAAGPLNPYAAPTYQPEIFAAPVPAAGRYALVRSPRRLADVITVLFSLYALILVACLVGGIAQHQLLHRSYTVEEAEANDLRQKILGVVNIITFLACGITFCMWVHRLAVNSLGFGARGMRDTPGWCVGWYFVPIMNLFRPYQNMKEIWQISGDPQEWESQRGSGILVTWWTLWIISSVVDRLAYFILKSATTLATLRTGTMVAIVSCTAGIGVTIAAIVLVRALTRRQETLVARSVEQPE